MRSDPAAGTRTANAVAREEEERRAEGRRRRDFDDLMGRMPGPRWYEVLGLSPSANRDDIKRRFRTLSMRHHPDHGGDQKQFIRIKHAYDDAMRQAAS